MRRQSFNLAGHAHFLTFTCFNRCQILADPGACQLLARSINDARDRLHFALWADVFMPDHVHLLPMPCEVEYSISAILKRIKGPFAKRLADEWRTNQPHHLRRLEAESGTGVAIRIWQRGGGFDRNLFTRERICSAVEYIEANPVRKGFVANPADWKWSSAAARAGVRDVPIHVDPISWDEVRPERKTARSSECYGP
jgi:putative transposase